MNFNYALITLVFLLFTSLPANAISIGFIIDGLKDSNTKDSASLYIYGVVQTSFLLPGLCQPLTQKSTRSLSYLEIADGAAVITDRLGKALQVGDIALNNLERTVDSMFYITEWVKSNLRCNAK